jgi:hypothetical protein
MDATKALQKLRSDPDYFLKYYPVWTAGSNNTHTADAANPRQYFLHKKDPTAGTGPNMTGKIGHYGATRPGTVFSSRTHEISSWVFNTFAPAHGVDHRTVTALSVPMTYCNAPGFNVNDMNAYYLDGTADIMITGQLSGCCFCWTDVGGTLLCTHLKPQGATSAVQLQNMVVTNGRFHNHPHTPLGNFGRSDYPGYATVIGVRGTGGWSLYAQLSNDQNRTIAETYKLHPGAMTLL